jgi:hypothetical protein
VHELGHAFAAVLSGRVVHGIRIRRNHSGDALSSGRGVFGTVISGVLGYPAPAIVGAAQLVSVFHGYTAIALFAGGVVLLLTLIVIRNLFGALVVLASVAVSAALWVYATPAVQSYALLVLGAALLVGAVRGLLTVVGVHLRRRDQLPTSDAYLLYRRTGVPSVFWLSRPPREAAPRAPPRLPGGTGQCPESSWSRFPWRRRSGTHPLGRAPARGAKRRHRGSCRPPRPC